MNPARLCQLFNAKFNRNANSGRQKTSYRPDITGQVKTRFVDLSPREDEDSGSRLAAYFIGGE